MSLACQAGPMSLACRAGRMGPAGPGWRGWAGQARHRLRAAQDPVGQLTVTGMVTVNGRPAATGDIVSSGSAVRTAAHSSAVVSLGKLGRVEVLQETRMKLRYDDSSISILIDAGSVRVQTGPGVAATITTKDD